MANKRVKKKISKKEASQPKRKHVATRQGYVSDDLRKRIKKANARIRRLQRAGLQPEGLVIAQNILQSEYIRIPRNATLQQVNLLERVTNKFLSSAYTTVRGAKTAEKYRRENFNRLVNDVLGKVSNDALNLFYNEFSDIDIKSLLNNYVYDKVVTVAHEVFESGVKPTTNYVDMALKDGVAAVISAELTARGYPRTSDVSKYGDNINMDLIIDIGVDNGINAAIAQYDYTIARLGG